MREASTLGEDASDQTQRPGRGRGGEDERVQCNERRDMHVVADVGISGDEMEGTVDQIAGLLQQGYTLVLHHPGFECRELRPRKAYRRRDIGGHQNECGQVGGVVEKSMLVRRVYTA